MTLLFIIIAVVFTVAMTVLMVRPFSASRSEQLSFELLDEEERKIEALVSRKVALVQSLRDIEYDFKTNKISEDDYQRFKKSCERQAVGIMRRLDELHGGDGNWDEIIDRAVADRLQEQPNTAEVDLDDSGRADNTETGEDTSDLHCPGCGHELEKNDRFCSQCGQSVDIADESLPTDDLDSFSSSSSSPPSEVAG